MDRNCVELIRNTPCPHSLSSGRIRNVSGKADGIELKLSARVEGDVEKTEGAMRGLPLILLHLLLLRKLRALR